MAGATQIEETRPKCLWTLIIHDLCRVKMWGEEEKREGARRMEIAAGSPEDSPSFLILINQEEREREGERKW